MGLQRGIYTAPSLPLWGPTTVWYSLTRSQQLEINNATDGRVEKKMGGGCSFIDGDRLFSCRLGTLTSLIFPIRLDYPFIGNSFLQKPASLSPPLGHHFPNLASLITHLFATKCAP